MVRNNSVLYGTLAATGLLVFYLVVISFFQGIDFAFLNIRSLWYFVFPLAIGFGIQIGLYTSIRHTALMAGTVAGTGGVSASSMLACCSHFLFSILPIAGISGLTIFLMKYQPAFLSIGILSNAVGITLLIKHKRKMKENIKFPIERETHLKGGEC